MKIQRAKLSGFPYEITKEGDVTVVRFFPKSLTAEYPNDSVLVLRLDKKDRQKLIEMLS